ncbi:SIMPL domain-containing protein [Marinobacter sp. C2H3]|uniref:SIMPL domain-containing protein n=1 Tax=Marinobacter sp. C2H3 TaxID=3119003 RepID=UPI00300EFB6E
MIRMPRVSAPHPRMNNRRPSKAGPLLAGLMLAIALVPAVASAGELSLTGQGAVRYQPDSATLSFSATAENPDAATASEQVRKQMSAWRKKTAQWRDQLEDYTDASLSLYTRPVPSRDGSSSDHQVAVASQTVSFTLHDLKLLNPLLEQAQALGLEYQLNPRQFFHSNQEALEQQALGKAIDNARAQCAFVASKLGQSCGAVKSMTVNGGYRPVPVMMAEARMTKDAVSSVGPQDIEASVSVTFELD